ncbi:MAG: RNA polymerase subunit sigma-70, partial [Myxococcales bacterium]|nr:RNA polymerase subunit sigma-70 [Myxococcales bacterium]
WMFAVAYRQLCKHYRSRVSEQAHLDFASVTAIDLEPSPSRIVAQQREQQLLLLALRSIPFEMQVALELHYWEHMSDAEIARALEVPLGTMKSRIRRARQLLAERIAELAESPQVLESTLANLEEWAAQLREQVLPKPDDED